jgi:pyruvate/2-oxoglutarate/acetoin dehydrogenase E1 component
MKTVAETIHELSVEHCRNGGLIMGQNLEAVQNVCGTVPVGEPGVEIMPTCEAAGMGMAIGAALSGRPVIHVIRFASFLWLQSSPLVYYAARAKSEWGYDLPLFVRVSSDDGIGPVHSGVYHSPFVHMPGLKVVAPMTPGEYKQVWREFQETKQPVLVSEHRRSYTNVLEMPPMANAIRPQVLIVAISAARFAALEAMYILDRRVIEAEVYPLWRLSDFNVSVLVKARNIGRVLIVDSGYKACSVSEHLAYEMYKFVQNTELDVHILGMTEPPGVNKPGSPTPEQIAEAAMEMVL